MPEDLERLAGLIEKTLEAHFDARVAKLPELHRFDRAKAIGAELKMGVSVLAEGGIERRSGDLSVILSEIDARSVDGVRLGNLQSESKAGGSSIVVRLGKNEVQANTTKGARISVTGNDHQWVSGALAVVQKEVARGVPRWAFMNGFWAIVGTAICLALALVAAIGLVVGTYQVDLAVVGVVMFGFVFTLPVILLFGWIFPRFELVRPGSSGRGRAVIAQVVPAVGIALGVAGLIVPFFVGR